MQRSLFLAASFAPMFLFLLMLLETIAFYKPNASFQSSLVVLEHFTESAFLAGLGAAVVGGVAAWVQSSTEGWARTRVLVTLAVYAVSVLLMLGTLLTVCHQNATNVPADFFNLFMLCALPTVASLFLLAKDPDAGHKKRTAIILMIAGFSVLPIAGVLMVWNMMIEDAQTSLVALFILFFGGMQGLAGFAIDRVRAIGSGLKSAQGSTVFADVIDEHS